MRNFMWSSFGTLQRGHFMLKDEKFITYVLGRLGFGLKTGVQLTTTV